jgi:hypothetical protein
MSLPHLAPVHGVRDNAAYANLTLVHPPLNDARRASPTGRPETKGAADARRRPLPPNSKPRYGLNARSIRPTACWTHSKPAKKSLPPRSNSSSARKPITPLGSNAAKTPHSRS